MRRRQIYAQQNKIASAVLPGVGAEAGPEARPEQPAPQGITYQHNERTTVTLPISDFKPETVRLGDEVARMGGLDRAIGMIEANSPPGPVHIDFNPKPVEPLQPLADAIVDEVERLKATEKRAKKLAALEKARATLAARRKANG